MRPRGWADWLHAALNPRDCDCPRDRDCTCDAIRGRDTDFDDTFAYQHPDSLGELRAARGKWWLGGRCSLACGDVECPPCRAEELHKADQLPPASMPWLNGPPPAVEEDRAMPDANVPTDEQVEQLSQAVDQAFAERDRFMEEWRRKGRDEDEQVMEMWDRTADRLLTSYNAACQAQYAESDRRRDINVARHARDEAAKRGDLAEAMQGDDWLEDHGMHGDERATCHQCQSWGDHAHDPFTNRRITAEEYERDHAWRVKPGKATVDMSPPAEPYQSPTEKAHHVTAPDGNTFVAMCGAETYESDHAKAKGYRVEPVEGHSRAHGFEITKRPSTAPTTTTTGAAMTSAVSYGSLKARILGIADNTLEQQGPLQQAIGGLDEQIAAAQAANEESQALTETIGTLMQARQHCEDALGMVHQANTGATNAAAGLQ